MRKRANSACHPPGAIFLPPLHPCRPVSNSDNFSIPGRWENVQNFLETHLKFYAVFRPRGKTQRRGVSIPGAVVSYPFRLARNSRATKMPKTMAAAIPPAVAVRPPVRAPSSPRWATASWTPLARE